jgi:hypothetical protein
MTIHITLIPGAQKAGIAEQSIALEYLERDEDLDTVRDGLGMMYSGECSIVLSLSFAYRAASWRRQCA